MNKRINISSFILIAALSVLFTNCQKGTSTPSVDANIKVTTTAVTGITQIRATVRGKIISDGGSAIIERGVVFDTVPNPTIASKKTAADTIVADSFSVRLQDLKPNKMYYAKAYVRNSNGIGYGEEVNFTTHAIKLGDAFQGGVVFYMDATGLKGLIAAQQGLDYDTTWGCAGVSVPGTTAEIGAGKANTVAITKACKTPGIAAAFSDRLDHASFSDWFLPSKEELTEMYKHRNIVTMNNAERWSSTEVDANNAWALSFDAAGNAVPVIRPKGSLHGVRPIRSFSY